MNPSVAEYLRALSMVHEAMLARSRGFSWRSGLQFVRDQIVIRSGPTPAPAARSRLVRLCDDVLSGSVPIDGDPLDQVARIIEQWIQNEPPRGPAAHQSTRSSPSTLRVAAGTNIGTRLPTAS